MWQILNVEANLYPIHVSKGKWPVEKMVWRWWCIGACYEWGVRIWAFCLFVQFPSYLLNYHKPLFIMPCHVFCRWLLLPFGNKTSPPQPFCLSRDESTSCIVGYRLNFSFGSLCYDVVQRWHRIDSASCKFVNGSKSNFMPHLNCIITSHVRRKHLECVLWDRVPCLTKQASRKQCNIDINVRYLHHTSLPYCC